VDCSKGEAVKWAQKACERIAAQTIILRREKIRITASMGVASFPDDAHSKQELIENADAALYQAKRQGKNREKKLGWRSDDHQLSPLHTEDPGCFQGLQNKIGNL
jgi:diguanylate cyclase (GGDEF)-like protein